VGAVQVRKGDTLYAISRRHGVPLRDLIEVNRLRVPYLLAVGQRLTLPRPRAHVVAAGDTVYGISRRYGVDMSALMRLNAIRPPHTITVGQRLRLPAPTGAPGGAAKTPAPKPAPAAEAAPAAGMKQAAAPGEPGGAARTPAPKPAPAAEAAGPPEGGSAPAKAPATAPDTAPAPKPRPVAVGEPPPRSGRAFQWPLRGEILSTFGAKKGGRHNDGINIQAPRGTPVRAAENGIVAYAGNELRGFGKLVLIKHADGWVTAYAHNDVLLVARGDRVTRGQAIARAGSTGTVSTPQLHFEIRRGTRAVNPAKHLVTASGPATGGPPSRAAARGGRRDPG
jgi:murein DD-endopeptidase MepM/ murein hydrolase activator NlpD